MKDLIAWKHKPQKKPLVLIGVRQVGKTSLLQQFAKNFYEKSIYVNFELNKSAFSFFEESIEPQTIIRNLEVLFTQKIDETTLLILDEIQACEQALTSLKYFCELMPHIQIACAGSLLGVAINRNEYSFPVGKVELFQLHPFSFEEFLLACGKSELCAEIKQCFIEKKPLAEGLHTLSLNLYKQYLIIGGMPEAIATFVQTQQLLDVAPVQKLIVDSYVADMAKYAEHTESIKISACYKSIPVQLAKENKKFMYKVVQRGGTATIFGAALDWLLSAGTIIKVKKTEHGFEPVSVYADLSSFKIYMADVGLLVMQSGLPLHTILLGEENTFMGAIAENYVAMQFASKNYELHYWTSEHLAEVDFIIQKQNELLAIEVKSGIHTRSKSLFEFCKKYPKARAIRISAKNFGETESVFSVPLYAAFCI